MGLRVIPALDRNPLVIKQAQSTAGKSCILALFLGPLYLLSTAFWAIGVVLVLVTFLPQYRRVILTIAAPILVILQPSWMPLSTISKLLAHEGLSSSIDALTAARLAIVVALIILLAGGSELSRPRTRRWLKRPIVLWHAIFFGSIIAVSLLPLAGYVKVFSWAIIFALGGYFWYFCYTIIDRAWHSKDESAVQTIAWRPVWAASNPSGTPFGKGPSYLLQIEAQTAEVLAVTQLKGLKLLWWALLLRAVLVGMRVLLHGTLLPISVPTFEQTFAASVHGHPYSPLMSWGSLILSFLENLLDISVFGHQIIACRRIAGFRALRNTWRPLESRTLAEFWNRYFFYFKELLVDVFFFPTFVRYFRGQTRLRRFAATLAAASFGNMIFHFFRDVFFCAEIGVARALATFHVYAFYCLALGTAIGISQLRTRKPDDPNASWFRRRLWPGFCVGGFYCVLHVFDDTTRAYPITEHFRFLGRLVGLG